MIRAVRLMVLSFAVSASCHPARASDAPQIVKFQNGALTLGGELFLPSGAGPFPAVLYNHGSAPGMLNSEASKAIGPRFAAEGWVFFMPYRRGQGLSAASGEYIVDQIRRAGSGSAAAAALVRLLTGDHLDDQMAALRWLKSQKFVKPDQIAVAGNSFGGIETVLGVAQASYCAAVDASGAAQSWRDAPELQAVMKDAVRNAHAPIFFFQAENDFDLSPSRTLAAVMKDAGKPSELKIYPRYGDSAREGHSFAYKGSSVWFEDVFRFIRQNCR